ncbi:thioredoxin domain-containing protein [Leucobacter weissii]|uniref:Thioredoxin domain-containing protein n=1 Tax=Leucobacter weissii TaxID=1983706 RepID=A0A939MIH3_9MICO|nr:thioredoxin domain-containing protein [Leucobacter weissii]MBO1900630.1 thioredoxin domain-containing protein [Leucobacter weissii]
MAEEKLTKQQRRDQAREQARVAREAEKKREKRNRVLLQGGVVLGVLAILAVVGLVLMQTLKPAGPGPENMVSGGVTFGTDLKVEPTPALAEGEERQPRDVDWSQLPIDVTIYVDYMCPACGAFEQQYGEVFQNYIGSGDITLTVYPINFLDAASKYSTRAANLVSCVVEQQPDYAFTLHNQLLSAEVQPTESSTGLTDEQLIEQAEVAGATATDELRQCVKDQRFGGFISANYKQVSENGVLSLAEGERMLMPRSSTELQPEGEPQRLVSTPTVTVNGKQWDATRDGDLEQYILKVRDDIEGNGGSSEETPAETEEDTAAETD